LECHYHLLVSHVVTPSMEFYSRYGAEVLGVGDIGHLRSLKRQIRAKFATARTSMPKSLRLFVRDFRSTWVIAQRRGRKAAVG